MIMIMRRGMAHPFRSVSPLIALALAASLLALPGRASADGGRRYERTTSPPGTIVYDAADVRIATFTDGARTVTLMGPQRTIDEGKGAKKVSVTTTVYVRALPAPFTGHVDDDWLTAALTANNDNDNHPDILLMAKQYIEGAPDITDSTGRVIAGDAHYGPIGPDGTRQEGADFNDYLGISWQYPGGPNDEPEADEIKSLDCSGFMRMVWGYRAGLPLTLRPDGIGIPRRSEEMAQENPPGLVPGVIIIHNSGQRPLPSDLPRLNAGDVLFFDASPEDDGTIDHVGMYLGLDTNGNHRFISSRKSPDGPTLGDFNGPSILDGDKLYARSFRGARRL